MLIYNRITELVSTQFILIALLEVAALFFGFVVLKKRFNAKNIVLSVLAALVLSLISLSMVRGSYSGMAYRENFGWPLQYHSVSRNIENSESTATDIAVPFDFNFNALKFLANSFFWAFIPIALWLGPFKRSTDKKQYLPAAVFLLAVIIATIGFSVSNSAGEEEAIDEVIIPTTSNAAETDDITLRKRAALETAYPDFKDFEDQDSFAGQSVQAETDGSDHYFAYIVHGSGLPIVEATCFRVDRMLRVYKIGEFPDMLDSYIGYNGIDAKNCIGIK